MELKIARIVSYLFHPLLIPLYMILLLLNTNSYYSLMIPFKGKLLLTAIIFLTTILFPVLTGFLFYKIKLIRSFFPVSREERIYLLFNIAIFYYLSYYLLKGTNVSLILSYFMLGATILVVCVIMISFFHNISLHMIGAGGMTGALLGMAFSQSQDIIPFVFLAIFCAGLTGSARLKLNSQKPMEVYSGFLVGITVMFVIFRMI